MRWKKTNEKKLRKYYGEADDALLLELFPDRKIEAIHKKAEKLGLKKPKYRLLLKKKNPGITLMIIVFLTLAVIYIGVSYKPNVVMNYKQEIGTLKNFEPLTFSNKIKINQAKVKPNYLDKIFNINSVYLYVFLKEPEKEGNIKFGGYQVELFDPYKEKYVILNPNEKKFVEEIQFGSNTSVNLSITGVFCNKGKFSQPYSIYIEKPTHHVWIVLGGIWLPIVLTFVVKLY
ncbi:MAG: hypothetical protein U9M95_01260 [Candidatus Altiarchaeota archaeon]|nr:hypothetical protein [Candidatus Altiarchaeota archaeon]